MKVAVLAPVAWRTPPRHYGPWEQIASNIAEGIIKLGGEVTLFATGDSITEGTLDAICATGYEEDRTQDAKVLECLHISNLMEKARQFDIIHNNFDFSAADIFGPDQNTGDHYHTWFFIATNYPCI
jgi:hypothetical protein